MLRSTFHQLARNLTPTARRPARAATRRPALAVEGLEDRLALSTATQTGSTLFVNASAGTFGSPLPFAHVRPILLQADAKDHGKLDVFDTGNLLGQFPIASIKTVSVNVPSLDAVTVDDSNGLPFANGTSVSLFTLFGTGIGINNSLTLQGSKAINGPERFTPGTATQAGSLVLGGVTFQFTGSIASVDDEIANTGALLVTAPGPAIDLLGSDGLTESLISPASGNGTSFTFAGKAGVELTLTSPNATATLDATAAARGLKSFAVSLTGSHQALTINATPSTVPTAVQTHGSSDTVNVRGNSGTLSVVGNATARVVLGTDDLDHSKSLTSGLKNDVSVSNAGQLVVADGGNLKTREQVKVTESSISGTGLLGNNAAVIHYVNTALSVLTGQLANTYTVVGSRAGARFTRTVSIEDRFSAAGLNVRASVDSGSGLSLNLFNKNPATGSLSLTIGPGGKFKQSSPPPNGVETVTFVGGLTSTVTSTGFNSVVHS